jgi:stress response protein SCP2
MFTATSATQYIHAGFGTLNNLYVQIYDSAYNTVGDETHLSPASSNKYISRTVTSGQVYYVRVRPYSGGGTYQIGFNATVYPPGTAITTLTANVWADGDITSGNGEQWFMFTATSATQYIHASFGTLTNLYVQVYDSAYNTVEAETNLSTSSSNKYTSRTVTSGQVYYVRVRPIGSSYSGTYRIGFNATVFPPGATLTVNVWADGDIPLSNGEQWFTFTATAATQYIHVSFGTLTYLSVQVYDSANNTVGAETNLPTSYISLTVGQVYYVRVRPYSSSYRGTYQIGFNATVCPPGATTLTANVWANGDIPSSNGVQWFMFTATAATQYIHVSFGTLNNLYVQVYDSANNTVGVGTDLSTGNINKYISRTVTSGQVYYVRVIPNSGKGTYQIGFNTLSTPPP